MSSSHSISVWIDRLRQSDPDAARALWEQFFARMAAVARRRLAALPRRAADEEDVALSAFADFVRAAKAGRFPDLHDREGLWALLLTFTVRKAQGQVRHERRQRRGAGEVRGDSAFEAEGGRGEPADDGPPPDEIVAVQDELAWLLEGLAGEELRRIALRKLEGYGNDEIAEELGCARATVERRLRLIRATWQWLLEPEEEKDALR
jgi:DNA-directed RNA polymerase specialized sigma24 family protein